MSIKHARILGWILLVVSIIMSLQLITEAIPALFSASFAFILGLYLMPYSIYILVSAIVTFWFTRVIQQSNNFVFVGLCLMVSPLIIYIGKFTKFYFLSKEFYISGTVAHLFGFTMFLVAAIVIMWRERKTENQTPNQNYPQQ